MQLFKTVQWTEDFFSTSINILPNWKLDKMCAEWRQIWRSLIWLRLRRGFPARHKESIILLLLLLFFFTLLLCSTDIWRGRLWDRAQRRKPVKEKEQRWKWNTEREIQQTSRTGSEMQRLSGCLSTDPDTPVFIWELFYQARLTQFFYI